MGVNQILYPEIPLLSLPPGGWDEGPSQVFRVRKNPPNLSGGFLSFPGGLSAVEAFVDEALDGLITPNSQYAAMKARTLACILHQFPKFRG